MTEQQITATPSQISLRSKTSQLEHAPHVVHSSFDMKYFDHLKFASVRAFNLRLAL